MQSIKILRLPDVCEMVSASKPAIYAWIKKGLFPAPIKIGPQASGWVLAEIEEWLAVRMAERVAA